MLLLSGKNHLSYNGFLDDVIYEQIFLGDKRSKQFNIIFKSGCYCLEGNGWSEDG